jgi:membrane-bound metal-dependent hydrolase YbcI (DUF457 family)
VFLSHGAAGLVTSYITKSIWDKKEYNSKDKALLYSGSIITAVLPDLDLAYAIFDDTSHHEYITHKPFIYVITASLLFGLSFILKNKKRKLLRSYSFLFISVILVHILLDAFGSKMAFFYPFSKKTYSFFSISPLITTNNIVLQFMTTPICIALEILLLTSAVIILLKFKREDRLIYKFASITFGVVSIIALIATTLVSLFYTP